MRAELTRFMTARMVASSVACSARQLSTCLDRADVLDMHTMKGTPVVVNKQIVVRPIMVVALTYDHRLLGRRQAVTFLG